MTDHLAHADWSLIPDHMQGSVRRWIENGIPPGSFLSAVIRNDLTAAVMCADDINRTRLHHIVGFFHSFAPSSCWGSPELVEAWARRGGLVGLDEPEDAA